MIAYKQKNKDTLIRIYLKDERQLDDGSIMNYKVYLSPQNYFLKAYVRNVQVGEDVSDNSERQLDTIECVINYRPNLSDDIDKYIEFRNQSYKIISIDNLDFKNTELKIKARRCDEMDYDGVEYRE